MASPLFFLLFLLSTLTLVLSNQTYIIYMNPSHRPSIHPTASDWYKSSLQSLSIDPSNHLLYSYSSVAHGFAARLNDNHLPLLQNHPSVLLIVPDPLLTLHTTRTPSFLGLLPASGAPLETLESASADVVIGVLDTGVWAESPSFSGHSSLPPVPSRWKGECEAGVDFAPSLCNNKLIGARSFSRGFHAAGGSHPSGEYASARDQDGHGTHTASTAAGNPVTNASLLGYATGTARGMATGARVAVYKVCWSTGCLGSDILAGIESAVSDGVDILSLSLGGGSAPYFRDTIAVGAFGAVSQGVFVSCSAGNSGPSDSSVANSAPWIMTVGAGTLDRDFPSYISVGSGQRFGGVSLYSGPGMGAKMVPIVYGSNKNNASKLCLAGTLDPVQVKGRIVLCDRGINARVEKGLVVKLAGGAGMILANTAASGEELVADSHLLPAVAVGKKTGDQIRNYVVNSKKRAKGVINFGGTVLGIKPSPVVAAFSSRGPNVVVPEILKPDLIGPGVNILAGWSDATGPTGLVKDGRRTQFNIVSGTSMSCPHISGVAALLKAAHPNWSPAALKSALMTTSYISDNTNSSLIDASGGQIANVFAYGAGYVDPQKALSPGLIYDLATEDYVSFLCSLRYDAQHIQVITKRSEVSCAKRSNPGNLNYPSFSVVFGKKNVVKYTREVTNVGLSGSVYDVKISGPDFVSVKVKPVKLVFKNVGQKARFSVTFVWKNNGNFTNEAFGWLSWVNAQHVVRSPIAYTWGHVV